jgi:hypothetical protein
LWSGCVIDILYQLKNPGFGLEEDFRISKIPKKSENVGGMLGLGRTAENAV